MPQWTYLYLNFIVHPWVFLSFCCCSVTKSFLTLCDSMDCNTQAPLSSTISLSLLKFRSTESFMLSNHLIVCCPLLPLSSNFPSIRVFSNESAHLIRWPKYWSFSFRISPCNEYSGLISFGFDWFDLLSVQGTLRSLLQHRSLKTSTLQCSAIFMVQLSHPYMTTGKTMDLTMQTFVGKEISLLFDTLSRFAIAFLPIKQPFKPFDVFHVVLEKTLESSLDNKDTKPVHPKGNQPWICIGKTDAETQAPIVWPPDPKSRLIGKDPHARKGWRQEEKGVTEDEMVVWHHRFSEHELE